ncbi:MAG: molecular chaperone DnaJ [Geminicoccaceae bacterium]
MAKQDYYEMLGVSKTASGDDLKRAYRKLAMKYHPDQNPGDAAAEARFKELSEAYEVLKDDQKRAAYDQFGHAAFEQGGMGGGRRAGGFDFSSFADVFDDLFGDVAGGGRSRGGQNRGADLRYNLEISLEEAFNGKKAQLTVPTSIVCGQCNGSGSEGGAPPVSCPTCRGMGRVRSQQGFFTVERTCASCSGTGMIIRDPCGNCSGSGRTHKDKSLAVNVPRGVEDGTRIRLSGEGEAGLRGGQAGDLYIFITVTPHRLFKRDGTNLYCRVPIPMTTAAMGGDIEVPTIDGRRIRMPVQPGSQTGKQFRLREKGMTELHGTQRGDMFVEVMVETPVNLTTRQKELLREFEREGGGRQNPESEGFFSKVKEFWGELGS